MKSEITFLLLFTSIIFSQQKDSLLQYYLGDIEVSTTKDRRLTNIDITSDILEMQNAYTPFEALQFSTGIYASISGKNEARLSIRGFEQRQVSIMIDGAPVYIPYDGSFDLNAIQLAGFDKISLSKNSSSILYGPNSMGGTINIISDKPEKIFSTKLNYQDGSCTNLYLNMKGLFSGFYYNAAYGMFRSKGFNVPGNFSATVNEDGGLRNNSRYNSMAGTVKIGTNIYKFLEIAISYDQLNNSKDVPVNIYASVPRYWRYNDWDKSLTNLMFNSIISHNINIKGNAFYDRYKSVLDSYDDGSFTTQTKKYAFHSTYDDNSYGFNLTSYISNKLLPLTKIITLYKRDTHKEQNNFPLPFKRYAAEIITIGIEEEFTLYKNSKTVTGISYDKMNPLFAADSPLRKACSSFNGNAGFNYTIDNNIILYSNVSGKTRFPTLKEFYSDFMGSSQPNHNLAPERSYNYEIGASFKYPKLSIGISLFYNNVSDLIQMVSLGRNNRQYQNINKAVLKGTELELKYKFTFADITLNYTVLSARDIINNSDLPNRPAFTSNILLAKAYSSGFGWNTEFSFVSKQYSYDSDSGKLQRLSGYTLLNARIAQKFYSYLKIYIRINNITDKYYETDYGFPQPGREYFAGILFDW